MDDSPERRRPPLSSAIARGAVAAVLLAAIAGALVWLRSRDDGAPSAPTLAGAPTPGATAPPDADTGPLDGRAPIVGQPAPDFALRRLDGTLVRLSELRGNVVWINFWASWCRPCKKELPEIQRLADEHPDDLVVLAVNWREGADVVRRYLESTRISLPALLDRRGDVYRQYKLRGLPDSFFIDREGTIRAVQFGYLTASKMRERLAAAGLAVEQ